MMNTKLLLRSVMMAFLFAFTMNYNAQVVNGDFETWTSTTPDGWTTIDAGITVTQETTTIHGGASAANFNVLTGTQGDTDFRQSIDVEAGVTYDVSFWTYHTEGGMKARLFVADYLNFTDPALVNQWQEVSTTYLATATETIQVGLRFYDTADFDGEEIVYIDDFVIEAQTSTTPTIVITNPADGSLVTSGEITVSTVVNNFVIGDPAAGTFDGYFTSDIDGTMEDHFATDDFVISGLTDGAHTLTLTLVDANGDPVMPAASNTVMFEVAIPSVTQVNSITELRAGTIGEAYQLSGEAILTYQQSFRNQKYIQDADAGILIDDNDGNLTTSFAINDGITGITGTLGEFGNMLQFVPLSNAGSITSSNNSPDVTTVTLNDLATNFEQYEARLVKVEGAQFISPAVFENGTAYPITDDTAEYNLRTSFYNVDYIGWSTNDFNAGFVGIPNSRNDGEYVTPRDLNDFLFSSIKEYNALQLSIYPNPNHGQFVIQNGIHSLDADILVYDLSGRVVYSDHVNVAADAKFTIALPTAVVSGLYTVTIVDGSGAISSLPMMIQ